jgi:hypothetical protein
MAQATDLITPIPFPSGQSVTPLYDRFLRFEP